MEVGTDGTHEADRLATPDARVRLHTLAAGADVKGYPSAEDYAEALKAAARPPLRIRCVLTLPNAKMPFRAHEGDSGMDLYTPEAVELRPGVPCFVDLGVVLELPADYEGQIRSRSGLTKSGLTACSGLGTVDSSYRGNLGVTLLWHCSPDACEQDTWTLAAGTRIAQLVIMPVPRVELVEVESVDMLSKTARADKGFGSTG